MTMLGVQGQSAVSVAFSTPNECGRDWETVLCLVLFVFLHLMSNHLTFAPAISVLTSVYKLKYTRTSVFNPQKGIILNQWICP